MKAFLDYIQEIKIKPDIDIKIEFLNTEEVIIIKFNRYDSLVLYKNDSYNFLCNKYRCRSQRIFFRMRVFDYSLINHTSMRFL